MCRVTTEWAATICTTFEGVNVVSRAVFTTQRNTDVVLIRFCTEAFRGRINGQTRKIRALILTRPAMQAEAVVLRPIEPRFEWLAETAVAA